MKYSIEQISQEDENEVIIRCHVVDDTIESLIHYLESSNPKISGKLDSEIHLLEPGQIFYIESVDKKVFIYSVEKVYCTNKKLYEFEEELKEQHFFRSSKSMILNIDKVGSVKPLMDGSLEATLLNDEKVRISRKYVPVLKRKLGI